MAQIRPTDPHLISEPGYVLPLHSPNSPVPAGYVLNELQWHQMSAIATMLLHFFQPKAARTSGMLIADDVGVGKTLENYGMIATVTDVLDRAIAGKPLPPILSKSLAQSAT